MRLLKRPYCGTVLVEIAHYCLTDLDFHIASIVARLPHLHRVAPKVVDGDVGRPS
jgi:hypothetical protein